MKRRVFIALLGGAAATWPLAARAQVARSRVRRVGILTPYIASNAEMQKRVRALRDGLGKLGWVDGVNIQFDEYWTGDDMDRVRSNAAALMGSDPDVVVAVGGRVIPVLLSISRTIPIVVPGSDDPVAVGWAASLARPGGNITGFTFFELSMFGKALDILKEIAPATVRLGVVFNPDNPNSAVFERAIRAIAAPLGLEPIVLPIHGLADIESAIASLAAEPGSAVYFVPDLTVTALYREVTALMERHHLAAIYSDSSFMKSGGLLYYGTDRAELFHQAATYVDRILRGEKAGELPFQQPTKYQLMINQRTAKALGLTIPTVLLATADEVIE